MLHKLKHTLKSMTETKYLRYCIIIQSLLLLIAIFYNFAGEESVYTYQAIQILYHNSLLDVSYGRPPLFAWLIIAVSKVIGVHNILPAARIVCLASFFTMSAFVYKLVKKISGNPTLALYAVASFYTVQMVAKLAWLAYADPLFGMLTFAACALLWLYTDSGKVYQLIFGFIALFLACLTKSFTCLVVFAVTWWVLFFLYPGNRSRLYNLRAFIVYCLFIVGLAYFFYANIAYFHRMFADVVSLERVSSTAAYLKNVFLVAPFSYFIYATAPALPVAFYLLLRRKVKLREILVNKLALGCAFIFIINALPYWFSHHIVERRYLYPLYPFAAVFAAIIIFMQSDRFRQLYCRFLLGLAVVLFCTASWLPFLFHSFNYMQFARNILKITGPSTFYVSSGFDRAGSSIQITRYAAGYSNVLPIGNSFKPNSYIFTGSKMQNMQLVKSYKIYDSTSYLYFNPVKVDK